MDNSLKTIDKSDDFRSITYDLYELIALTLFFWYKFIKITIRVPRYWSLYSFFYIFAIGSLIATYSKNYWLDQHTIPWIMYTLSSCLMYHKNLSRIVLLSCNRQMLFCCTPVHRNAMHYGCYLEFAIWRNWFMCLVISVFYLVTFLIKIIDFWKDSYHDHSNFGLISG